MKYKIYISEFIYVKELQNFQEKWTLSCVSISMRFQGYICTFYIIKFVSYPGLRVAAFLFFGI